MISGWQTIIVALIILGALVYVGRRALARLRSFRASTASGACETGCGTCASGEPASATPVKTIVQIGPRSTSKIR